MSTSPEFASEPKPSRRTLAKGAAWTAPVIMSVAAARPAAASPLPSMTVFVNLSHESFSNGDSGTWSASVLNSPPGGAASQAVSTITLTFSVPPEFRGQQPSGANWHITGTNDGYVATTALAPGVQSSSITLNFTFSATARTVAGTRYFWPAALTNHQGEDATIWYWSGD